MRVCMCVQLYTACNDRLAAQRQHQRPTLLAQAPKEYFSFGLKAEKGAASTSPTTTTTATTPSTTQAKKATPVKAEKGSASKASTAKKAKAAAVEITGSNQKYKHSWVKGASPLKPEESWRSLDVSSCALSYAQCFMLFIAL
jgi:hypothetical protein